MPITPLNQRKPGAAQVGTGDFLGDGLKNAPAQLPQADTALSPVSYNLGQKLNDSPTPSEVAPVVPVQSLADKNRAGRDAFAKDMEANPQTAGLMGNATMGGTMPAMPAVPQVAATATEQANAGLVSPTTPEQAYAAGSTAAEQAAQAKAIGESYKNDTAGVRTASDLLIEKQNLGNANKLSDQQRAETFKQSTLQQEARTRATLGQINAMRMRMGSGTSAGFDQQLQETYDMQKGVVGYLSTMNDIESQDALRAYDYSMTKLDNKYNDTIQSISNMAASRIKDAKAAGKLSTMADISAFRNDLAATFDEIAKTSLVFAQEKSRVSEYYKSVGDKLAEQNKLANEIDETASQQLGYLVNKRGQQYGNTKTPYVDYALKKALALQQNAQDFSASQSQLDREQKLREQGLLPTGGSTVPTEYGSGTTDFTSLAPKYPNVAAFKNNNPAGITWNDNFAQGKGSAALLDKAGISYSIGTDRPQAEGGNYVKFNSIEDGLAAQRVIMQGTYGNSTVGSMLSSWVGTPEGQNYAKQVASNAGINLNATVNSLTPAQLDLLQISKLQKESPGLYKELANAGLVEGNTINFAKPKVYTQEDVAAGNAPSVASEFMDSINGGNFTVDSPKGASGSSYTPAQVTSLEAFAKSNDQKDLTKNGLTVGDYNAYKLSNDLTPEQKFQVQQALSAVPAQLRNSDTESKNYIDLAKTGLKQGLTPQQIADKFTGFTIADKAVEPFAQKLRNTYNALENAKTDDIKTIAQLVNAKDYEGATRKVENTAYASLGADKQGMENNVAKYVRAFDRINEFVKNNPGKVGAIQGYFSGGMRNWTGDASVSEALADMATLNSQLVNQNVKGVPSDIDTKMLSQAFSTLTSGEANITGVLQQTKNEMISSLNADRSRLGLPELTDKDIGNYKNRAALYFVEQ